MVVLGHLWISTGGYVTQPFARLVGVIVCLECFVVLCKLCTVVIVGTKEATTEVLNEVLYCVEFDHLVWPGVFRVPSSTGVQVIGLKVFERHIDTV